MPQLQTYLVIAKRGSFFAYGEPSAIHYAKMFSGIHVPCEIVKEQVEIHEIGRFVLPAPNYSIN